MEYSIVKLTSKKLKPLKPKHVQIVTAATFQNDWPVSELFRYLGARIHEHNWIVVMKALIVVHILMREGNTERVMAFLGSSANISFLDISNFHDKTGSPLAAEQTNNLLAYSVYLEEKISCYSATTIEFVRAKQDFINLCRQGECNMRLLRNIEFLQRQINALLGCSYEFALINNVVTLQAYRLLIGDLMALFHVLNEAVIRILSEYFEMDRPMAEKSLQIYKNFAIQTSKTVEFFDTARKLKGSLNLDIPVFKHAPVSLAGALEEYLQNNDFDAQPRDNKKSGKSSSSKQGKSSKKDGNNKGSGSTDPQIIDFFDSIDDTGNKGGETQNYDALFGPGNFNEIQANLETQARDLQVQLERLQQLNTTSQMVTLPSSMQHQPQTSMALVPSNPEQFHTNAMGSGFGSGISTGIGSQMSTALVHPSQGMMVQAPAPAATDFTIESVFGQPGASQPPQSQQQTFGFAQNPFGTSTAGNVSLTGGPTQVRDPFAGLSASRAVTTMQSSSMPTSMTMTVAPSQTIGASNTNPFAMTSTLSQPPVSTAMVLSQQQQQQNLQIHSPSTSQIGANYITQGSQQPFLVQNGLTSTTSTATTNPFLAGMHAGVSTSQSTTGTPSMMNNSSLVQTQNVHIDPFTMNSGSLNRTATTTATTGALVSSSGYPSITNGTSMAGGSSSSGAPNPFSNFNPMLSNGNSMGSNQQSSSIPPTTSALMPFNNSANNNGAGSMFGATNSNNNSTSNGGATNTFNGDSIFGHVGLNNNNVNNNNGMSTALVPTSNTNSMYGSSNGQMTNGIDNRNFFGPTSSSTSSSSPIVTKPQQGPGIGLSPAPNPFLQQQQQQQQPQRQDQTSGHQYQSSVASGFGGTGHVNSGSFSSNAAFGHGHQQSGSNFGGSFSQPQQQYGTMTSMASGGKSNDLFGFSNQNGLQQQSTNNTTTSGFGQFGTMTSVQQDSQNQQQQQQQQQGMQFPFGSSSPQMAQQPFGIQQQRQQQSPQLLQQQQQHHQQQQQQNMQQQNLFSSMGSSAPFQQQTPAPTNTMPIF